MKACPHVSETGSSITHSMGADVSCFLETNGTKTNIRNSTVKSFSNATEAGKRTKVIASTTTFSAGDANIAASTDSVLIPDAKKPRAIGAMQLVQTASGAPTAEPNSVLRKTDVVHRRRNIARNVSA